VKYNQKMKRVLAVATGGGHWSELVLLHSALSCGEVKYVTTIDGLPQQEGFEDYEIITDANKHKKIATMCSVFQLLMIFIKYRPNTVITTGAAAGVVAVVLGKIFRTKNIWLESVANTEGLSLSAKLAKPFVDIMLTQHEHLADGKELIYRGSII
jgi:UDP-N-acetylglucosamine:LPS N-acetylglucosamine transferase